MVALEYHYDRSEKMKLDKIPDRMSRLSLSCDHGESFKSGLTFLKKIENCDFPKISQNFQFSKKIQKVKPDLKDFPWSQDNERRLIRSGIFSTLIFSGRS